MAKKKTDSSTALEARSTGADDSAADLGDSQLSAIDRALALQAPIARRYVRSLKEKHPHWDEDELVRQIEKRFLRLATATGVGIGGAAAMPALGTAAAMALTVGEGLAFAEACAFLTLGVAYARGIDMSDPSSRKTITLAILGGEKGAQIVTKALGQRGVQWSAVLGGAAPEFITNAVNTQVNRWIRRTIARRVGGVWAGRLIPFGIGAVIGGVGNLVLAKSVVDASRDVFAYAPLTVESSALQDDESASEESASKESEGK
ncbi:MAG: hypothetical protein Q4G21_00415 [Dermabacter sp.]|nr:hypothetical protein [Dermabacter sp.]